MAGVNAYSSKYQTYNTAIASALDSLASRATALEGRQVITQQSTVSALAQTSSASYVQAEAQAVATRVDLLLTKLKGAGVIAS